MRALFILWLAYGVAAAGPVTARGADVLVTNATEHEIKKKEEPERFIYSNRFHAAIRHADCIVIRDGGFDCCRPVDRDKILATITNRQELATVYTNLQFDGHVSDGCDCCGYPGMDWYCGTNLLALVGVKHCHAIRWKGFRGEATLTKASQTWLAAWLKRRGIDTKASPTMRAAITNDTER